MPLPLLDFVVLRVVLFIILVVSSVLVPYLDAFLILVLTFILDLLLQLAAHVPLLESFTTPSLLDHSFGVGHCSNGPVSLVAIFFVVFGYVATVNNIDL